MLKKEYLALLAFLFIALMPSIIYVLLSQSSTSVGMLISVILLMTFYCNSIVLEISWLLFAIIIILVLLLTNLEGIILNPSKVGGSLFFLLLYLIAASQIGDFIIGNSTKIESIFIKITSIMIAFGCFSLLFRFDFLGYEQYSKSIFTFYEPSHFALVLSPFFIVTITVLKPKYKFFYILSTIILSIMLPSLILILILLIAIVVNTKKIKLFLLYFTPIFVGGYIFLATGGDSDYFTSRLNISSTSSNLSALVYAQGWLDAYNSLIETNYLGLGFQQAGTNSASWLNNRIYELSGMYMNRNDGSFTASKIVSEFGVVGLFLVLLLTFLIAKAFVFLFKVSSYCETNKVKMIASIFLVNYLVELYFRSAGYFTLGTLFMLTGMYLLYFKKLIYVKNNH